jgi:hypothetical protein
MEVLHFFNMPQLYGRKTAILTLAQMERWFMPGLPGTQISGCTPITGLYADNDFWRAPFEKAPLPQMGILGYDGEAMSADANTAESDTLEATPAKCVGKRDDEVGKSSPPLRKNAPRSTIC